MPLYQTEGPDSPSWRDEEIRDFVGSLRRDGYATIDLGDEGRALCDEAVTETEAYFAPGNVDRVQDAWLRSDAVRALAVLPRVMERLEIAYGRKPFAFQTLNFRQGTQQAIHSDTIHFNSLPENFMCGVWIALEDVAEGAGPLVYYPGSQTLPRLTMRDTGVARRSGEGDYDRYETFFGETISQSNLPRRLALIPKGHAFVWVAGLAHGGTRIENPGSTRRSMVTHYYFENCLYFTPLKSDEERGRLYVRIPPDIETRGLRWPMRNGGPAIPSPGAMLGLLSRLIRNQPHVSTRMRPNPAVDAGRQADPIQ